MELKHLLSDINDLRIHKSNNNLSKWGEEKLKEYEFILTELAELKKLRVTDVSVSDGCLSCENNLPEKGYWCATNCIKGSMFKPSVH